MLNISLASLGMWNGTMDRNNKKKQSKKWSGNCLKVQSVQTKKLSN